jgi:hypothetical protein
MKWTSWLAAVVLTAIVAVVVVSSLQVGNARCEVCVEFRGRQACRAVDAATEDEARRGAHTNACALLASGVTDSLACERTAESSARCTVP